MDSIHNSLESFGKLLQGVFYFQSCFVKILIPFYGSSSLVIEVNKVRGVSLMFEHFHYNVEIYKVLICGTLWGHMITVVTLERAKMFVIAKNCVVHSTCCLTAESTPRDESNTSCWLSPHFNECRALVQRACIISG